MRQFQLQKSGNQFVPTLTDMNKPSPGSGKVLVRVRAASLNYRDHIIATMGVLREKTLGVVPLSDGAGEVEAVGAGVTQWRAGDRVAANFFATWITGRFDRTYHDAALGGTYPGMLSEYAVLPESSLVRIPEALSFEEASTLPCAALTAWQGLFERTQVGPGDVVLTAGTGGVSIFALQFAKAVGATVIITSSSDEKLQRAKSLGADHLINYKNEPEWDKEVLSITNGRGADHVMEIGGAETYQRSINCVAAGGHIHQLGVLSGFDLRPNLWNLQSSNATIHGLYVGSVEMFTRMNAFISTHKIKPVVDRVYPFEQATQAFAALARAGHFGKIVIAV